MFANCTHMSEFHMNKTVHETRFMIIWPLTPKCDHDHELYAWVYSVYYLQIKIMKSETTIMHDHDLTTCLKQLCRVISQYI